MIEYLVLSIILFYFIIASIEDIKKREVYDYINFSLSFIIIAIAIFHSLLIESIEPIKYVGFGILIGFAIGSLFYYLGIWGGGDSKFLIGFSASSYYLIQIANFNSLINVTYEKFLDLLTIFFNMFLSTFLNFILYLDFLFLILIIILKIFYITKNKDDKFNSSYLFLILFLLTIGLYYNFSNLILILIGFLVFVLIFFAKEDLFLSIYFKIKKNVLDLKEGNKICENIYFKKEKIIDYEKSKFSISKENLIIIKEKIKSGFDINIKKIFPLSSLIALNYIVYIFKIITVDKVNLEILSFLFKFLFFSFIFGGIIAIFIIFYFYLKNFKKIKIEFLKYEKLSLIIILIIILIISILNFKFILLLGFYLVYLFLKISKKVEKYMFIKKKNISKIVLGDWIAQDIFYKNKLLYSVKDFKLGINEIQLEKIKYFSKQDSKLKNIYVKDGIAFLPPLFIGFIILLI